jgi:hypothetical protein
MENQFKYLTAKSMKQVAFEGNRLSLQWRIAPWVMPLLKGRRVSVVPLRNSAVEGSQRDVVRTLAQFISPNKEVIALLLDMKRMTFEQLPTMPSRRTSTKAQLAQPSSRYNAT